MSFSWWDVLFCWIALLFHAAWCHQITPKLAKDWVVSSLRALVQLSLLSYALVFLFRENHWGWTALATSVMILVSSVTVAQRSGRTLRELLKDSLAALVFSLALTLVPLALWLKGEGLNTAAHFIPIVGILLGNALSGLCLGVAQWEREIKSRRWELEYWISRGATVSETTSELRAAVVRTAMTVVINSMTVSGIVSIPGQLTGQLLAGGSPNEAVKIQIMILFMVSCMVFSATWLAIQSGIKRHFDNWGALK